jgi:ribosomal protein S16
MVGWYNPFSNENNCQVRSERIQYWLAQGAQLSPNVEALILKVAPDLMKEIKEKRQQKRLKTAAKRRALKKEKKGEIVSAAPKQKKQAAPVTKEPKAPAKPKASRAKKAQPEA